MAQSVRISDDIYELAVVASAVLNRSLAQQIEYWAKLGARVDLGLTTGEALAMLSDAASAEALSARITSGPTSTGGAPELAELHARIEAQVQRGDRAAASLVSVPKALATAARLKFPSNAFGEPQSW